LITVGSTDKDYRTIAGNIKCATGTNFPEENVDDETKEEKCKVIGNIRSTFLAVVRLDKPLAPRHYGRPGIKQDRGGKEVGRKEYEAHPKVVSTRIT
jgi:hypothetical protein